MPRTYERRSNRQSWSQDALNKAIEVVLEGKKISVASIEFEIPYETLRRKVKEFQNRSEDDEFVSKKALGFKPIFTPEQESIMENHFLDNDARLQGFTAEEVRAIAYDFAESLKLPHPFDKEKKLAGYDWFQGFLRRHEKLSLRKPEPTSTQRFLGFNKTAVDKFYDLLDNVKKEYNFAPEDIYNVDETGVSCNPKTYLKVLSVKGKRQVGSRTSAERGTTVTACVCFSATGKYMPPLLIFPRKNVNKSFLDGSPSGSWAEFNGIGWMDEAIFTKWLQHFIAFSGASLSHPVLLILDGHATHVKNIEAIKLARENGVVILCLPPHCSHRMQPLDVSYMKPLSNYYSAAVNRWMRNHPKDSIQLKHIYSIFGEAYIKASTMENAVNGFEKTGIHPPNRNVFTEKDFAASNKSASTSAPSPSASINAPTNAEDHHQHNSEKIVRNETAINNTASTSVANAPTSAKNNNQQDNINKSEQIVRNETQENIVQLIAMSTNADEFIEVSSPTLDVENINLNSNTKDVVTLDLFHESLDSQNNNIVDTTNDSAPNLDSSSKSILDFKKNIINNFQKCLDKAVDNFTKTYTKEITKNCTSNQIVKSRTRARGEAALITTEVYESKLAEAKAKSTKRKSAPSKVVPAKKKKPMSDVTNFYDQNKMNFTPVQFNNNYCQPMTQDFLQNILFNQNVQLINVPYNVNDPIQNL